MVVSGAHLLYQALVGADGLGTPGFKDIDRDGTWWDDTFRGRAGRMKWIRPRGCLFSRGMAAALRRGGVTVQAYDHIENADG